MPPPHCHPYPVRCQLLSPLFPLLFGFGKEDTLLHTHIINHLLTNSGSWWGSDGKRAVLMDGLDTGSLDSPHGQTGFATTFFLLIPSLSMSQGIKEPMIRRKHFPPHLYPEVVQSPRGLYHMPFSHNSYIDLEFLELFCSLSRI